MNIEKFNIKVLFSYIILIFYLFNMLGYIKNIPIKYQARVETAQNCQIIEKVNIKGKISAIETKNYTFSTTTTLSNATTTTETKTVTTAATKPLSKIVGKSMKVPTVDTSFKTYTAYTMLNRRSQQWKLQQKAYTDENGLRKIENYYLAAMGSYYSKTLGDCFRIKTSTGAEYDIMLCDYKADKHTDNLHQYTVRKNGGCVTEFYVDYPKLNSLIKRSGTVGKLSQFSGDVVEIIYLGYYNWKT